MEERYVEWCKTPMGRKGLMVRESLVPKIVGASYSSGYTTVYSFNKEDANKIRESRCSKGFSRFEVGASRVAIDLDEGEEQLTVVEKILQREGLGYEIWFSGGKGFHVFIDHRFICSTHLPYSHLCFLKELSIPCDESLYQHGRLLSLEGRVHPKTKKKKNFVKCVGGKMAEILIVEKPKFVFTGGGEDTRGLNISETMITLANLATIEPRRDQRHTLLWQVGLDLCRCGLSDQTIFDLLRAVMKDWEIPKSDEKLRDIVKMSRRQM